MTKQFSGMTSPASSPKTQEKGMFALLRVDRKVFVIEIRFKFLGLESESLIEKHGRIRSRYMESQVLAHASLEIKHQIKKNNQIFIILPYRYYVEAWNERRGPSPRLTAYHQKKRRSGGESLAILCPI